MTRVTGERIRVDPGGVSGTLVLLVAIATGLLMALGVIVAWELKGTGSRAPTATPTGRFGAPPREINGIEMSLLVRGRTGNAVVARGAPQDEGGIPPRAMGASAEAERRLRGYGWTDRARARVHIPIARAMELYLAREADAAAVPATGGAASGAAAPKAPKRPGGQP